MQKIIIVLLLALIALTAFVASQASQNGAPATAVQNTDPTGDVCYPDALSCPGGKLCKICEADGNAGQEEEEEEEEDDDDGAPALTF